MFVIGRCYFKNYFNDKDRVKEQYLLLFVCVSFSVLPDFVLIIYYTTKIYSFDVLLPFHMLIHIIIGPIALFYLKKIRNKEYLKREPIWIMGLWAVILHIIMDLFIPDYGIWI